MRRRIIRLQDYTDSNVCVIFEKIYTRVYTGNKENAPERNKTVESRQRKVTRKDVAEEQEGYLKLLFRMYLIKIVM